MWALVDEFGDQSQNHQGKRLVKTFGSFERRLNLEPSLVHLMHYMILN